MSQFIKLPPSERQLILQQAAIRTGYAAVILEKDAWVCWTLKMLFSLPGIAESLTFKGGTSLSKAYGVIARFSEDIDITIDKGLIGVESEALEALSGTAREKALEELTVRTADFVREQIKPKLTQAFVNELMEPWSLEIDPNDSLSLLFHFPSVLSSDEFKYVTRYVKLKFGARADSWPNEKRHLSSYIFEQYPDVIPGDTPFSVPVLAIERTFWEKATILHAEYHRPMGKPLQLRISRHYYDLSCLAESSFGSGAIENVALLKRVAHHKNLFFRAGWAKYHEALPGSLRIVPDETRLEALRTDYRLMRDMFFVAPPEFAELMEALRQLEGRINRPGE